MVFSSISFIYTLLPILLVLYFITMKLHNVQNIILLSFSLLFYAWGGPKYLILLLITAGIAYGSALAVEYLHKKHPDNSKPAKLTMALGVTLILAFLVFYKYTGFLIESINLIGFINIPVPRIILPIGISFFSFQGISYIIDVYRKETAAQKSYLLFLLYLSLFCQLIAGPIVRYDDVEAQLGKRTITASDINDGIYRFAVGLGKKIILADNCGAAASSLFEVTGEVTLLARWMGALFFTLQLYYDFSGYSDMAIGLGRILGFKFPENFNYPFISTSATEFWRRWHITLGSFFRDYVYIPLGGKYKHQIRNLLIVWLLTGLWHGASWNFALWGVYFGVLIIIEKHISGTLKRYIPKPIYAVLARVYFVLMSVFGMAIFYFNTNLFVSLGYMLGIGVSSFTDIITNSLIMQNVILLAASVIAAVPIIPTLGKSVETKLPDHSYMVIRIAKSSASLAIVIISTILMAGSSYSPFLYYRF
nr:MBOAT family protein [Clostridia bacterium]